MNLEDESLLSAYLDDELDPSDRLGIEWAIESDAQLRERLQALSRTKELLASLPIVTLPVDLTASVMSRIAVARPRTHARTFYRVGLWVATAASVLITMYLSRNPQFFRAKPLPAAVEGALVVDVPATDPVVPMHSLPAPDALISSIPRQGKVQAPTAVAANDVVSRPTEADLKSVAERDRLLSLLDRPDLRRIVIPIDVFGENAAGQVNSIVRDSSRKDPEYARFTITQGLVIDPSLPNGAELFVVVVDENERRHLVDSLERQFPEIAEEQLAGSDVPALLADVGKVAMLPGQRAAGLIDPPPPIEAVATKFDLNRLASLAMESIDSGLPLIGLMPTRPSNAPQPAIPKSPGLLVKDSPKRVTPPARTDGKLTLVVWVTRKSGLD